MAGRTEKLPEATDGNIVRTLWQMSGTLVPLLVEMVVDLFGHCRRDAVD